MGQTFAPIAAMLLDLGLKRFSSKSQRAYGVHLREDGMREKNQGTIQMDRMKGLSMSKHLHKTSMYMQGKVRGLQ
jgi:hypothetical protein